MLEFLKSIRTPKPKDSARPWDLDTELLHLTPQDVWTIRDAVEGCAGFGGIGSGKTSGLGKALRTAYLRANFGGVVMTAKADETQLWIKEVTAAGRADDLIIFGPGQPWRFNFLSHEIRRTGDGAGLVENVLKLLLMALEIAQGAGGRKRDDHHGDRFWVDSVAELMRAAINTLCLSGEDVSIANIYRLIMSLPRSVLDAGSRGFLDRAYFYHCASKADACDLSVSQRNDLALDADLFLARYPALGDKTRMSILTMFTSMTDILNRSLLRDLLCTETNLTPEVVEHGKIIILAMPLKEFGAVGAMFQLIFKFAFQLCIERRRVNTSPRPVFLFIDESHYFVSSYDMQFLSTCRSVRVCAAMLTQNISNYYAMLGNGEQGKAEVDSLLALLNTKVFHNSAGDPVTSEYASRIIGRTRQLFCNGNVSGPGSDPVSELFGLRPSGSSQNSAGFSESFEYEVQPRAFSELRTGGPANDMCVDAIVFQNGKRFSTNGRTWLPVTFSQRT